MPVMESIVTVMIMAVATWDGVPGLKNTMAPVSITASRGQQALVRVSDRVQRCRDTQETPPHHTRTLSQHLNGFKVEGVRLIGGPQELRPGDGAVLCSCQQHLVCKVTVSTAQHRAASERNSGGVDAVSLSEHDGNVGQGNAKRVHQHHNGRVEQPQAAVGGLAGDRVVCLEKGSAILKVLAGKDGEHLEKSIVTRCFVDTIALALALCCNLYLGADASVDKKAPEEHPVCTLAKHISAGLWSAGAPVTPVGDGSQDEAHQEGEQGHEHKVVIHVALHDTGGV